jgi:hypothetical protein
MSVELGSNDFFGVPFPLVIADRFFHIYRSSSSFKIDVFRWDEATKKPIYEVIGNVPQDDAITTNPTGIVTFSGPANGAFSYKFRPKPGVSQIFGTVPVNNQTEVVINDREICVYVNGQRGMTFRNNQIAGCPIGIQIFANGGMAMGVNRLPDGMVLVRKKK